MPSTAAYRYTAKVEPTQEVKQTCSFEPFVERQWNQSYVWVQIPQTGNVTVPEDYYDRFYGKVGGEPPNYADACKVLVEAAAELIPVIKADGRVIGNGKPGPISMRMISRFREITRETGTPIYS